MFNWHTSTCAEGSIKLNRCCCCFKAPCHLKSSQEASKTCQKTQLHIHDQYFLASHANQEHIYMIVCTSIISSTIFLNIINFVLIIVCQVPSNCPDAFNSSVLQAVFPILHIQHPCWIRCRRWRFSLLPACLLRIKGMFDWLYSGIGINRIKTLFNLIGHNSCKFRRKKQLSYISRPSHYL